ncbi:MAG: hypothetical protein O3A01_07185 [bacterium]|nr:hypothetical protein [bacterium]
MPVNFNPQRDPRRSFIGGSHLRDHIMNTNAAMSSARSNQGVNSVSRPDGDEFVAVRNSHPIVPPLQPDFIPPVGHPSTATFDTGLHRAVQSELEFRPDAPPVRALPGEWTVRHIS